MTLKTLMDVNYPVSSSHQFVVFVQFAVLEHVAEYSRGSSGSF